MATLHIEHPISDFETWWSAFERFADARRHAGVRAQRVQRPIDDAGYIVVDLDFDTVAEADTFRHFLVERVWADESASPALTGTPRATILIAAPRG